MAKPTTILKNKLIKFLKDSDKIQAQDKQDNEDYIISKNKAKVVPATMPKDRVDEANRAKAEEDDEEAYVQYNDWDKDGIATNIVNPEEEVKIKNTLFQKMLDLVLNGKELERYETRTPSKAFADKLTKKK